MSKIETALKVLAEGGYFRHQLETQYRGGEKFVTRLRDKNGHVVKGVGFQTRIKLEDAGKLKKRATLPSSTWPEEWVLKG